MATMSELRIFRVWFLVTTLLVVRYTKKEWGLVRFYGRWTLRLGKYSFAFSNSRWPKD